MVLAPSPSHPLSVRRAERSVSWRGCGAVDHGSCFVLFFSPRNIASFKTFIHYPARFHFPRLSASSNRSVYFGSGLRVPRFSGSARVEDWLPNKDEWAEQEGINNGTREFSDHGRRRRVIVNERERNQGIHSDGDARSRRCIPQLMKMRPLRLKLNQSTRDVREYLRHQIYECILGSIPKGCPSSQRLCDGRFS